MICLLNVVPPNVNLVVGDIDIPKARKLLKLATKPQTNITLGSNKNQTEQPSRRKRPNPNSSEGQIASIQARRAWGILFAHAPNY